MCVCRGASGQFSCSKAFSSFHSSPIEWVMDVGPVLFLFKKRTKEEEEVEETAKISTKN